MSIRIHAILDAVQSQIDYLPSIHWGLGLETHTYTHTHQVGLVVHAFNAATQETKIGKSKFQALSKLQSNFKVSLII